MEGGGEEGEKEELQWMEEENRERGREKRSGGVVGKKGERKTEREET